MSKIRYKCYIYTDTCDIAKIERIINKKTTKAFAFVYELIETDEPLFFEKSVFSHFLDLIEPHFLEIQPFVRKDFGGIIFNIVYEYDEQCNLEFDYQDLQRMGKLEISLTISAYQHDEDQDNWKVKRVQ